MRCSRKIRIIMPVILAVALYFKSPLSGGILLNEISAGGASDWVELKLTGDSAPVDISAFFVTMYYGSNERISGESVTVYPSDIPDTPWDDRFAVIHFTGTVTPDETDSAGDLNNNGVRDLYCANYGLWNTDCCVSIDSDDDPANNGITDFVAFSNRDGSINSTIASYINSAAGYGMWESCASPNVQDCCVFIGKDGMNSYSTLSRTGPSDTNSMVDFAVTPYATPGRDNVTGVTGGGDVIRALKKHVTYDYDRYGAGGEIDIPLFLYGKASLRVRIFNAAGYNVYTGPLLKDIDPGYFTVRINASWIKGRLLAGLYPVSIEAVSCDKGGTGSFPVILVVARRK